MTEARSFEKIDNFRDYGGYRTAGGTSLRRGLLYRSAHYCDATPADLASLEAAGITAVIDLRGPAERRKSPSPALAAQRIEAELDTQGVAPHLEAAVKGVTSVPAAEAAMRAVYADMPRRPMIIAAFRGYLDALATTDGATLVHCAAGKDRTGIAVALLQAALGVHPDDILAEYLLTNTEGNYQQRIATSIALIHRNFGPDVGQDAAHALVTVKADYLESAFATMKDDFGGLDSYLARELAQTPDKRAALAARLTTPR